MDHRGLFLFVMKKNYAEQCNYWKTSQSSPDSWLDKTCGLIEQFGGEVLSNGFGSENFSGRAAYMIQFKVENQVYRIVWPVMPSEYGDTIPAKRQAATMLFHDVKAKCVSAAVLGADVAFFSWKQLGDGSCAYQLTNNELEQEIPKLLESKQIENRVS